jgi:endonuclease-3
MDTNKNIKKIIEILEELYPDAGCSLEYMDPLQLLISTQLAAQCTDARVNQVTPALFNKYKNAQDFAQADQDELEQDIKSTGFFRNKAKNIIGCCKMLVEKYGGIVPGNMDDLLKLPGVGRKTANLVLGDIFKLPSIVIDTHAGRISRRLGLTDKEDPEKVEYDLMDILPKESWTKFCHQLVYHGRALCNARNPKCSECRLRDYCLFNQKNMEKN